MTARIIRSAKRIALFPPFLAVYFAVCPTILYGQTFGTSSHTVTVSVQPVTVMQITLGTVNLNISGSNAIAGQDQMSVTDQSSTLLWGTNSSLKKITASSNLASPLFALQVIAVNPTTGSASPQSTLSTTASDLVLNIGRSSGSCALLYTAIALASQGTGTDSHTITFTIQTQ